MSKLGARLIESTKQARAIARGEALAARVFTPPAAIDVAAIRNRTGLTQAAFASRYGFSVAAVRDWEQGRREPEASARTLLLVIDREPAAVERALSDVA